MRRQLARLVEQYAEAARVHSASLEEATPTTGNKTYARLRRLAAEIAAFGGEGRRALAALMDHESVHVRWVAAADMLELETEKAAKVLEEAQRTPGLVGFTAKMTLEEWRSGNLKPAFRPNADV